MNIKFFLPFIIIVVTLTGCKNKTDTSISEDTVTCDVQQAVEVCMLVDKNGNAYITDKKDTTMSLVFKGIAVGTPVKMYIGNEIPQYPNVDTLGAYSRYSFRSTIQSNSKEYPTYIELYCINDTIALLVATVEPRKNVNSDVLYFKGYSELMEMYTAKYGATIDYLPSCYLITFIDTNDRYSISKRYDSKTRDWHYDKDKYYTYNYNVWGEGAQHIVLTGEVYHWDANSFERGYYGKWELPVEQHTSNDRVFLIYGDDSTFRQIYDLKAKWNAYCFRQQEIKDSIQAETNRRMDSIRKEIRNKNILNDASQI